MASLTFSQKLRAQHNAERAHRQHAHFFSRLKFQRVCALRLLELIGGGVRQRGTLLLTGASNRRRQAPLRRLPPPRYSPSPSVLFWVCRREFSSPPLPPSR